MDKLESIYKTTSAIGRTQSSPGEWNSTYLSSKHLAFDKNGMVTSPAMVYVLIKGFWYNNNVILKGPTEYIGIPNYKGPCLKNYRSSFSDSWQFRLDSGIFG